MAVVFPEYERYDAVGLAQLVANGEMTADELLAAAIDRFERLNPTINAVISTRFDAAAAEIEAGPPAGPFYGVPYLIKDLAPQLGEPVTFGSVLFRNYTGEVTPEAIERMLGTGLVSLGRTNTPEFGLLPTTEPALFGSTRNPWNLEHSAGGSSGGAAAAVAAGIVPMANASDGGGSIRIPASACGLFGMKPTRGRIPTYPPGPVDYLSTSLCVSRSVRDAAALLDAISAPIPGARYTPSPPARPFADEVGIDPQPLRIAITTESLDGRRLAPECVAAVAAAADLLVDLGHHVEEAQPSMEQSVISDGFLTWWMSLAETAALLVLDEVESRRGGATLRSSVGDRRALRFATWLDSRESGRPALEPFTWGLIEHAMKLTPARLLMATTDLQAASYALGSFLSDYDVFVSPVLGEPPIRLGSIDQTRPFDVVARELVDYVPYTPIGNFSGFPAMTVPLHWTDGGLPIGVHFMGLHGAEGELFRLAGQLERARPWFNKRPPTAVS